jgi:hypothetical protein
MLHNNYRDGEIDLITVYKLNAYVGIQGRETTE